MVPIDRLSLKNDIERLRSYLPYEEQHFIDKVNEKLFKLFHYINYLEEQDKMSQGKLRE